MKSSKPFLLIILLFLTSRCDREKCEAFSGSVLAGKMETYFGAYKAGNWWVYQNQNGTKKDSIYITAFADSLIKDEINCTVLNVRRFALVNTYLASMNNIAVVYDATTTAISFKAEAQNASFPTFTHVFTDSLIRSLPAAENPGNNKLDSVRLGGTSYYNILTGKRTPNIYYFGKDRGLVGWITPTDTFRLVSFSIL